MKNIMLILVIFFISSSSCFSDVYVVTREDKSIFSLSEQNDAVVPAGYSVDIIKGKGIIDLTLGDDLSLYNYNGKKFTLDDKKVGKKNKDLQDAAIDRQAKADAKASGIAKLKALGLTDSEVQELMK